MLAQSSVKMWKRASAIILVGLLLLLVVSQTPVSALAPTPSDLNSGPYVDKLVYKVIANQDQRMLALQAGEIEMDSSFFDPVHLSEIPEPDIDIFSALRNGYGHITINTRDYPLNISGLRRAFAFAFDKTRVTVEIMDGFSQEHDSLVPYVNGWCVEDEFDWHYYDDQADLGNQILDDLGFDINETSGFRVAPNGEPFDIKIGYASSSPEIAGGCAQIGVDALHALHIDAEKYAADTCCGVGPLDNHGSYDMIFYAVNFYSNDVDWLAYEYWSEYADVPYQNPTNFANETYDSWREQLLYGTTYEEVHEAAAEMQKILHYNVPRLVVYENVYMQGYRSDTFTGHVEDLGRYITGPWTMRKIHKVDGTLGGTVPIAIDQEPDSFNIYLTNSAYSAQILTELYSSLYTYGPDLNPWPDLATNMITETHSDNPAVPDGHTRFTVDIIQNATWSDGTPLTADDVAFSYTYVFESAAYGNPAGADIGDLVAAYAPNPYRVVLEFNTESYWHFSNFAFDYIIPEHIFNDETGIGYEGWEDWNPVFNPADPHVTCGPFLLTDYEDGEFYELSYNPTYHYRVPRHVPQISNVADIVVEFGTIGNDLTWFVDDDDPDTYQITMNGTLREIGNVTSSVIIHNVDDLLVGNYSFTLTVFDESGFSARSTAYVFVLGNATTIDPVVSLLAISVSGASGIIIILVIISSYRAKRSQPSA